MTRSELLRFEHLTVSSGGVRLLDDLSLVLLRGEHVQITGVSGCGMEALAEVLAGRSGFDSGAVVFDGEIYGAGAPLPAERLGIFSISESDPTVPELTVAENIFILRRHRVFGFTPSKKLINSQAGVLLREFGLDVPPDAPAGRLNGSQKLALEFIRAYSRNARLIITSGAMDVYPHEQERLFERIRNKLLSEGITVLRITANPGGVYDRTIVMRDGNRAKTIYRHIGSRGSIMRYAVSGQLPERAERRNAPGEQYAFRGRGLSCGCIRGFELSIRRGEIVGVFDSETNDVADTLCGLLTGSIKQESGSMELGGKPFAPRGSHRAIGAGLGFIDGARFDRHLIEHCSVLENVLLTSLKKVSVLGFCPPAVYRHMRGELNEGPLRGRSGDTVSDAVGGDVLLRAAILHYRWRVYNPALLLYNEPFLHADAVLRLKLAESIGGLADQGMGVLVLSPRLRDLAAVCDRILICENGSPRREYCRSDDGFRDLPVTFV